MIRDFKSLRKIAESATGTARISWSPDEARWLLERMLSAEAMAGEAIDRARQNVVNARGAAVALSGISDVVPQAVTDYVATYYPDRDPASLWVREET